MLLSFSSHLADVIKIRHFMKGEVTGLLFSQTASVISTLSVSSTTSSKRCVRFRVLNGGQASPQIESLYLGKKGCMG